MKRSLIALVVLLFAACGSTKAAEPTVTSPSEVKVWYDANEGSIKRQLGLFLFNADFIDQCLQSHSMQECAPYCSQAIVLVDSAVGGKTFGSKAPREAQDLIAALSSMFNSCSSETIYQARADDVLALIGTIVGQLDPGESLT